MMEETALMLRGKKDKMVSLGLFAVIAGLFVLFFSTSTTPLLGGPITGDSAIFQTIGKYWARGVLPYIGLWDHKGPVIYFLNALGYKILDSHTGVFIVQIIFLTLTEVFINKLFLIKFTGKQSFLLTIVVLFFLLFIYSEGNGTEEYLLPFLMISFMGFFMWCENYRRGEDEHKPVYAFIYGITVAFCFLTRLTNAVGLCFGILFITVWLMVRKKWANLFANALAFLGGFFLLSLPFIFYFAVKGGLGEMWYGTIGYNLEYVEHSDFSLQGRSWKELIEILIGYMNVICLVVVGVIEWYVDKGRRLAGMMWMFVGAGTALWLFKSNGYLHYAIITLPYLVMELNELKGIFERYCGKKLLNEIIVVWMVGLVLVSVAAGMMRIKNLGKMYEYCRNGEGEIELLEIIPEEEKDSFIAYNGNTNLYLKMDVCPYYRFFIYQNWQTNQSRTLYEKIHETFEKGNAKWVLVADAGNVGIQDILDGRYECIEIEKMKEYDAYFKLYRLAD